MLAIIAKDINIINKLFSSFSQDTSLKIVCGSAKMQASWIDNHSYSFLIVCYCFMLKLKQNEQNLKLKLEVKNEQTARVET